MIRKEFDGLEIKLASPEDILSWSRGEVVLPDTINYRTGKAKQKGLFCETIFGPLKNYECACGKYKWVRYKGIVCEKCWVEVTTSRVRRERMWHIVLQAPVAHIWYVKATPSRIGLLLNLSVKEIEKVINFVKYLVIDVKEDKKKEALEDWDKQYQEALKDLEALYQQELKALSDKKGSMSAEEFSQEHEKIQKLFSENKAKLQEDYSRIKSILANLKKWSTVRESDYRNILYKYDYAFKFDSGAQALRKLLEDIDLEKEIERMTKEIQKMKWAEREKAFKRFRLLINLFVADIRPEWMILKYLPVIPPDLRPIVQLEWGKFASSDVNYFYRRVLMRNLRLKKMKDYMMPEVIQKNEIRLLQEAVNNLFVGEGQQAKGGAGVKVHKSLTDLLSGKEGRFRRNLLGKRVDFSGRSIITVWPGLKLDEAGLPLYIALKIFAPFVMREILSRKLAHTPKQAESYIKEEHPIALDILRDIVKDKYILLNRAPTLHRLGIQAFKIKLMPGKTIRIHPLVCPAYNADFDGDQMAVFLPLSEDAQKEAAEKVASVKNILKPGSWEPIISHTQDMALGVYYLTSEKQWRETKWIFGSLEEVTEKFYWGDLDLFDKVKLKWENEIIETTVGRVIFNEILPPKLRFLNKRLGKKDLKKLLDKIYDEHGREETVRVADEIKKWWFKFSTKSGITMNVLDMKVPEEKQKILEEWEEKVREIHNWWFKGFLTDEEKHRLVIWVWEEVKKKIEEKIRQVYGWDNDVFMLIDSGAKGSWVQLVQLSGMKWLVASPSGEIIELPIKSSIVEGLSPIEYFISAHGGRKGKADTALRTAESGYLTRRLVDASQEVITREEDCGTKESILVLKDVIEAEWGDFWEYIYGRYVAEDVKKWDEVILPADTLIKKTELEKLQKAGIEQIRVRSPLTCKTPSGVCQKCFGMDLSTREKIDLGVAVGVVSSQSLWEPATQLTMRTFHTWGIAKSEWDITQGVKRVEELFEVRRPSNPAVIAPFDGIVAIQERGRYTEIEIQSKPQPKTYFVKEGYTIVVKKWDWLKKGAVYAIKGKSQLKVKEEWEVLEVNKDKIVLWVVKKIKKTVPSGFAVYVKDWDEVLKWQPLTGGSYDIKEYREIVWDLMAQKYIVKEVKKVYASQGQDVNERYMEVIVKQMFSKVLVIDSWDSSFIVWSIVRWEEFNRVNEQLEAQGKKPAKWERLILWITQVAKETESWLSAASFQETMRVLVEASTKWAIDKLDDLKSNVIVGKLLPLGDIYKEKYFKKKQDNVEILQEWELVNVSTDNEQEVTD